MLANRLQPHTIEITKPLVKAYKSAYAAYKAHLEEEKKKVVLTGRDKQADCVKMAGEKKDISYVVTGNGLKRKSDQTKESITALKREIKSL